MKTLLLFRHAKAGWDKPDMRDFDRTLLPEGVVAARRMSSFIKDSGLQADVILCSPASRTRETFAAYQAVTGCADATFVNDMYMASVDTLLALVNVQATHAMRLMIIGHNPGFEDLADLLIDTSASDTEATALLQSGLSTAGLLQIAFHAESWNNVAAGSGCLTRYTKAKSL